jgi:gamma-butyrobetaine dioxygenase
LDPEEPRYDLWLDGYLHLTELLTDPARQRRFRLDAGDALFVHGHRVLHGRTAFVADGRRHLQDCYFDFDDVLANADRLAGRAVAKTVV